MSTVSISVRLNNEDEALFKSYAKSKNMTLSQLVRNAVFEKIEDEYDLQVFKEALAEYKENPTTYSHQELTKMLGID